ncbi:bacterial peptide chain release factor 1 (bRF-1) [Desulfobulbus propionicus DSM 2032]|uniref:Peptide chain release factor 1 n=1 Tax=Desulfobulbus propionicus (strain ATCC 33891 / DSM 2032 / VKM B-1956 / 1pr3) TaxID=577650 RepID=A0A7U3YNG5_DESPD|nr:peptide chain release factor 1 [Desulfobulbus propionicus]ADW18613.1 bacterial peptide chain release factor 1 (bRF-1) [Desulfobulbus propionicus DSM 2032]
MFDNLRDIDEKLGVLERQLADPQLVSDQQRYREIVREHANVAKIAELYAAYTNVRAQIAGNQELIRTEQDDPDLVELAKAEIEELVVKQTELEQAIRIRLLPKDPNDDKNIFLEIRAGTGGDEAALFVADLFRMYSRYAEMQGWKVEVMSSNPIGIGGFKELIALVSGTQVYSRLKYESGVHRVQRVPDTETQGRIHTSAVTVAIIPEAEEVDLHIEPNELKFDVYRSSGPGGQSVNTTDSAVRVTHLPTGLVVTCQDEKSQHKNKAKALQVLRARLLDKMEQERHDRISEERKSQVGSGDRSERIRTYNFPQGRVTDHRINLTLYRLDQVMAGMLDDIILPIITHYQTEALKSTR